MSRPLTAPFLEGQLTRPSFVQRAMRCHWPDPTLTMVGVLSLAGCAAVADHSLKAGSPRQGAGAVDAGALGPVQVIGLGPPGADDTEPGMSLLMICSAVVAILLLCQLVCEKVLKYAFAQAVRGARISRSGLSVTLGSVRSWFFLGRVEIRNFAVQSPAGSADEPMLQVRRIVADLSLARFFLSFGQEIEISNLALDGTSILVDRINQAEAAGSVAQTDANQVMSKLQELTSTPASRHAQVQLKRLTVQGISVRQLGGVPAVCADLHFSDFSKETSANHLDEVVVAAACRLGEAALAALPRPASAPVVA